MAARTASSHEDALASRRLISRSEMATLSERSVRRDAAQACRPAGAGMSDNRRALRRSSGGGSGSDRVRHAARAALIETLHEATASTDLAALHCRASSRRSGRSGFLSGRSAAQRRADVRLRRGTGRRTRFDNPQAVAASRPLESRSRPAMIFQSSRHRQLVPTLFVETPCSDAPRQIESTQSVSTDHSHAECGSETLWGRIASCHGRLKTCPTTDGRYFCSSRLTPFLLDRAMSILPSPLKSTAWNCVPMPVSRPAAIS